MMEIITKTKLRTSFSKGVIPVEGSLVSFAIRPKTVLSPVLTTTPRPLPDIQWVPCSPIHRVSRKFGSVLSTVPGRGADSPVWTCQLVYLYVPPLDVPVRIDLSNFASEEISMSRTSAGSLLPALIYRMSPGTISLASTVAWTPSRNMMQLSGSIVVIDAMTRDEDQSCHALNAAWIMKTARRTMASARLATAGAGSPSGFQDMKTRIPPTRRMPPNPLKKYPNICLV